jgi:hypothetical protein
VDGELYPDVFLAALSACIAVGFSNRDADVFPFEREDVDDGVDGA